MNKKEREELLYDTAVAVLKGMSPGSVFQYAIDRQIQLMDLYSDEDLQKVYEQYKKYSKEPKKKTKGGGFEKERKVDHKLGFDTEGK